MTNPAAPDDRPKLDEYGRKILEPLAPAKSEAAPESDTPRTDAAWDAEWRTKALDPNADPAHGMCDFAMELEREVAQAQTRCAELEKVIRTVVEGDFDDMDPDDGLHTKCARRFLAAAIQAEKKSSTK